MHRSIINKGPVVTILTQSQHSSKHIQTFLQSFFNTKVVPLSPSSSSSSSPPSLQSSSPSSSSYCDALNETFHPKLQYKFNSHASICERSNTILHFLSIDACSHDNDDSNYNNDGDGDVSNNSRFSNNDVNAAMAILAITPGPSPSMNNSEIEALCAQYINATRNTISTQIQNQSQGQSQGQNIPLNLNLNLMSIGTKLAFLKYWNYRSISPRDLFRLHSNDLPFLDLSPTISSPTPSTTSSLSPLPPPSSDETTKRKFQLREIVLPFFDSTTYVNGKSMLQIFSESGLQRPMTGLYQWNDNDNNKGNDNDNNNNDDGSNNNNSNSIVFRPLPSPSIDIKLPPATFVYQCDTLDDAKNQLVQLQNQEVPISTSMSMPMDNIQLTKVGFNGYQNNGQLRVESSYNNSNSSSTSTAATAALPSSLEFRYCDAKELSSTFAEAHESLLAGSLDDLQNVNVMVEGTKTSTGGSTDGDDNRQLMKKNEARVDSMNGLGDCWVEFRANMKQPSGFFKKSPVGTNNEGGNIRQWLSAFVQGFMRNSGNTTKNGRSSRVAKAPDIPYQ